MPLWSRTARTVSFSPITDLRVNHIPPGGGVKGVAIMAPMRFQNGVNNMTSAGPTRRGFVWSLAIGSGLLLDGCNRTGSSAGPAEEVAGPADVTLRIGAVLADIAKDHTISTIGYNGSVPGPLIRLREGVPATVDIFNDTDLSELVHWHGQIVAVEIDGAAEEKSVAVPPHGSIRYQLMPQ